MFVVVVGCRLGEERVKVKGTAEVICICSFLRVDIYMCCVGWGWGNKRKRGGGEEMGGGGGGDFCDMDVI